MKEDISEMLRRNKENKRKMEENKIKMEKIERKEEFKKSLKLPIEVQEKIKEEERREKQRKNDRKVVGAAALATSTIVATLAVGSAISTANAPMDMSKYIVDGTKYEDYMENANKDTEEIRNLVDNIRIYEELEEKFEEKRLIEETQFENLRTATKNIEAAISSGMLVTIYRDDVFKAKMEEAYGVDSVKINYKKNEDPNERIDIILIDIKNSKETHMSSEDKKVEEVTSAVKDIVSLQNMEGEQSYTDAEIKAFIRIFNNMKGFSNLTFVKHGDKPLEVEENTLDYDFKTNTVTIKTDKER